MYEECLDVFNSMSYSNHVLDEWRADFNANYTRLSERFYAWQSDMKVKYADNDPNSEFFKKIDVFMNYLLSLYAALSPNGEADIQYRPHFENDETVTDIYFKFLEMMKNSPWGHLYNSVNEMAEWKLDMIWMGKRLFCIAYYDNPHQSWRQYSFIQNELADKNHEALWDDGAPTWAVVTRLKPHNEPFNDPHDPPFRASRLTGLLRGLRTFS